MDVVKIATLCIIACVLCVYLRQSAPVFALLVSVFVSVFILYNLLHELIPFLTFIGEISADTPIFPYIGILLRACAVGFLTRIASDICRDFGETAFSGKIELSGKLSIVLLSLPVIKTLFESIKDFIN